MLTFARPGGPVCVMNLAARPVALPPHPRLLLAGGPLVDGGLLPQDTAVWLRS